MGQNFPTFFFGMFFSLTHQPLVGSSKFKKLTDQGIQAVILSALSNLMLAMDRPVNILGGLIRWVVE